MANGEAVAVSAAHDAFESLATVAASCLAIDCTSAVTTVDDDSAPAARTPIPVRITEAAAITIAARA